MPHRIDRRAFLAAASSLPLPGSATPVSPGIVIGEPTAAEVGARVLAAGGNAVDAAVSAALTAAVVAVSACGIGGYGGHMTIALPGQPVKSIDFNSIAPDAARSDMFAPGPAGKLRDSIHHGWLAAGVPGTLAGMELALRRFGTIRFREALAPAMKFAREGFEIDAAFARAIANAAPQFERDEGSNRLFFRDGKPLAEGDTFRNPDLAALLETLAAADSADPFYRGRIARTIAAAFARNGGLVSRADMAAMRAREARPIRFEWRGYEIQTAPLTAGGATIIQTLAILKALDWTAIVDPDARNHARLEAMRIAWSDRLRLFGDPNQAEVPLDRLLSEDYATQMADRVRKAIEQRKPLDLETPPPREQGGTIHLSAVDRQGGMAALTLTHGDGFGARVVVPSLGLLLGHGVSRFDPRPGHPNSPGPRKRPLHNMCPTIVTRDGRPILAVGARGGRRIPNAVLAVLLEFVGGDRPMPEAIDAPRMHTEGNRAVVLDDRWPQSGARPFESMGYEVRRQSVAIVSAVSADPSGISWSAHSR